MNDRFNKIRNYMLIVVTLLIIFGVIGSKVYNKNKEEQRFLINQIINKNRSLIINHIEELGVLDKQIVHIVGRQGLLTKEEKKDIISEVKRIDFNEIDYMPMKRDYYIRVNDYRRLINEKRYYVNLILNKDIISEEEITFLNDFHLVLKELVNYYWKLEYQSRDENYLKSLGQDSSYKSDYIYYYEGKLINSFVKEGFVLLEPLIKYDNFLNRLEEEYRINIQKEQKKSNYNISESNMSNDDVLVCTEYILNALVENGYKVIDFFEEENDEENYILKLEYNGKTYEYQVYINKRYGTLSINMKNQDKYRLSKKLSEEEIDELADSLSNKLSVLNLKLAHENKPSYFPYFKSYEYNQTVGDFHRQNKDIYISLTFDGIIHSVLINYLEQYLEGFKNINYVYECLEGFENIENNEIEKIQNEVLQITSYSVDRIKSVLEPNQINIWTDTKVVFTYENRLVYQLEFNVYGESIYYIIDYFTLDFIEVMAKR